MVEGSTPSASASGPWNTVDALLYTWLARPRAERQQLLDELGAADPTLAAALGARLEVLQRMGLDQPDLAGPVPGSTFGPYRIRERIGAGGMGAVYLAEQVELGRRVALKVIRPDRLADASARERFRREARAVAGLRHRGICAVYDVGTVDDTPYLAMQYVEGRTLAQTLADRRAYASTAPGSSTALPSTPREIVDTLRTVEAVAAALHTAHEAGVVHRDVKPGNILIDTDGQPVLLDFGLAQDQGPMATDPTLTGSGDLVGTPAYMSPEQIRPRGRVDRRTDVYSLGVTLYECLTLERPFRATDQLTLCEQIERDPTPDPRRANPHVPADLGAVLHKALEKDPARRYATAAEFADDLRRVRTLQPVRARRVGPLGRIARWSRRNPIATAVGLAMGAGAAAIAVLLGQAVAQRDALAAVSEASRIRAVIGAAASEQAIHPALSLHLAIHAFESAAAAHDDALARETTEQLRASLQASTEIAVLTGHTHYVGASQLAPDGSYAVTGSNDGTVRVWDRSGTELRSFDVGDQVTDLQLLPDRRELLVATAFRGSPADPARGRALRIDLDAATVEEVFAGSAPCFAARALGDDQTAIIGEDGVLRILGSNAAELPHGAPVWKLAVSTRVRGLVATSDYAKKVRVFALPAVEPSFVLDTAHFVDCLAFSPARDELAIADRGGAVHIVDLAGLPVATMRHGGESGAWVAAVAWSPDGERLLTVGDDGKGWVWRRDGSLATLLVGHVSGVYRCAALPDGSGWVTSGEDATVRVWNAAGMPLRELRGHSTSVAGGLSFSQDGLTLLSAATDCTGRLWDLSFEGLPILRSPDGRVVTAQAVPGTDEIVATTDQGHVLHWDAARRLRTLRLPGATYTASVRFAADGRLVIGQFFGAIHCVDLATQTVSSWRAGGIDDAAARVVEPVGEDELLVLQYSWAGHPAALRRTTLALGEQELVAELPPNFIVHSMAVDGRGDRVFLCCGDGSVLRVTRDGSMTTVVEPTGSGLNTIALSPDERWLATGGADRIVRLYEVGADGTLAERCVMPGHESDVLRVRFAPDGESLVSASRDRSARVWSRDGVLRATLRGHDGFVYDAHITNDGKRVMTGSLDGTVRFWYVDPEDLVAAARRRTRPVDPSELAPHARLLPEIGSERRAPAASR